MKEPKQSFEEIMSGVELNPDTEIPKRCQECAIVAQYHEHIQYLIEAARENYEINISCMKTGREDIRYYTTDEPVCEEDYEAYRHEVAHDFIQNQDQIYSQIENARNTITDATSECDGVLEVEIKKESVINMLGLICTSEEFMKHDPESDMRAIRIVEKPKKEER